MKADRWLDSDSGFVVPAPFFIIGKHALDEPVRSNPPSPRTDAIVDTILLVMLIGTCAFMGFPQIGVLVVEWLQ